MFRTALKNKFAIITGGTGGVGQEIAKMFARNNVPVVITSRDKLKATMIANEIYDPRNCVPILGAELDLNNEESIEQFYFDSFNSPYSKPAYLINNAGVLMLDNIVGVQEEKINLLFKVNAIGPIKLTKYFLPDIINNRGSILFNSPPYAIDKKTSILMPYMQSKLAQTTFMKSLANTYKDILIASFWTQYPLATDAVIKRGIGLKEQCMCPSILAATIELMIFNDVRYDTHGSEILDGIFLSDHDVDLRKFKLGDDIPSLDEIFYNHLKSKKI